MAIARGQNPLHSYVNYTYLISLHLLTRETYNRLANTEDVAPGKNYKPDSVLIASAGVRELQASTANGKVFFGRNPLWNEDFYFENLKLESVIGLNYETRGTNSIMTEFSIIEPNGSSLLERLIETSINTQWMDYRNMVFALQIDFVGYDDDGVPRRILDQTKIIPIKFLGMSFKISERGSEYTIQAVPYNHQALQSSCVTIPKNLNVTASTVGEYFTSQVARGYPVLNSRDRIVASRKGTLKTEVYSICDAMNEHQAELVRNKQQAKADKVQVVFAEEIANSLLTPDIAKIDKANTNMANPNKPTTTLDYGTTTRQINAGTTLVDEINRVVRNSSFFLNQLPDPVANQNQDQATIAQAKAKTNTGPLRWWKIVPKIKLLDYDEKRKDYAKEITYVVKTYNVYGSQYPGTPNYTPPITRKYQYLFTGQNNDILSFDLNFDMAYYIAVSTNVYLQNTNSRAPDKNLTLDDANKEVFNVMGESTYQGQDTTANTTYRNVVSQAASRASQEKEAQNPKNIAAADIQEYLMNTMSSDMISLDMTIVGDPEFIKQDDAFSGESSQPEDLNGSIPMDSGEVYVEVVFKTPSDYNENTGLMDLQGNTRTKQSKFSGLYRVISIENNFSNGQFTQKLSGVRIFTDNLYNNPPVSVTKATTNTTATTPPVVVGNPGDNSATGAVIMGRK